MIKKVCVFWLWYQWKQYIKYFLKNKIDVVWVCKTVQTKNSIEIEFWINVYIGYKEILDNSIDLLILSAYPIDIYEEILEYSRNYDYNILSDLPITFDSDLLSKYLKNNKLFLLLMETKLDFFNSFVSKELNCIYKAECLILQNKENLLMQKQKKESIIVDTQYVLNNLLLLPNNLIKINYKFIDKSIKNIEYIIKLFLLNWEAVIYKYEDWKGKIYCVNENMKVSYQRIENIFFDKILDEIFFDIENKKRLYINEYYDKFTYILKKINNN